jgi:DNA-binding NarL/FixJ family response regulator
MSEPIRVIVVDDHPIYRSGISATLGECSDIDVVGQGASADDALRLVAALQPDVALLDVSMPGGGLQAAARIATGAHVVRVVMLTASEDEDVVTKALEAGAVGYALKGIGGDELVDIIRAVVAGGAYVSPALAGQLLVRDRNRREVVQSDPFGALSKREIEIARLLTNGMSNKEIARQLDLQEKTIKHHMTQILQKLRLRNRVEAAMAAREHFSRKSG